MLKKTKQILRYSNVFKANLINGHQRWVASQNPAPGFSEAKPIDQMPGYSKWEFVRGFLPGGKFYNKEFTQMLAIWRQDHGDIVHFPKFLGQPERVITYQAKDFENVFRNEGPWPLRNGFEVVKEHRYKKRKNFYQNTVGTLITNGEEWAKFRSAVNPVLMNPKVMKNYIGRISTVAEEFVERIKLIRDPRTLEMPDDFIQEMYRFALESVSIVALDKKLDLFGAEVKNSEEVNEFFRQVNIFFEKSTVLEIGPPIWKLIETKTFKEVINSLEYVQDFVYREIEKAIKRLEINEEKETPVEEKGVLEKLLKVDKKIATVMAIDMFFGGVDTTSSALAGILVCLSKFPEKQAKLREEIFQVLPEKQSQLTAENTQNLPYLRACIKEAFRLYPVTPGVLRGTTKDITLDGYHIPKGVEVSIINQFLLRDPEYFPEPNEFIPERWLRQSEEKAMKTSNPFVHIPFSFGPRSCVGKRIAEMELEIATMRIVRNFNIEFNYPMEGLFKNNLINVPAKPLKFKFTDL